MAPRDAVLFDIDGTLVDSTYHHAVAWHRAFARYDVPVALWRLHRSIGMGGDKLVGQVAGEAVEQRAGDDLRAAWREEYLKIKAEVQPLPGASALVRALSDSGFLVALASSGDPEFADQSGGEVGPHRDNRRYFFSVAFAACNMAWTISGLGTSGAGKAALLWVRFNPIMVSTSL